jgi:hypothetical protein
VPAYHTRLQHKDSWYLVEELLASQFRSFRLGGVQDPAVGVADTMRKIGGWTLRTNK